MIKSLKIIKKYYRQVRGNNIRTWLINQIIIFILVLFIFGYIFYNVTNIHDATAVYKYASFDAVILNISPYQARKIKNYDFVDSFLTYQNIFGLTLKNGDLVGAGDSIFLNTTDRRDVDYTHFNPKFIIKRDEMLLNDDTINPIFITESLAKKLNVEIGSKVSSELFEDFKIEYTVAGIYSDVVLSARVGVGIITILDETTRKWILEIERMKNPNFNLDDVGCNHGFVKFNDQEKGIEFLNSFYSDFDYYNQNVPDVVKESSKDELNSAIGDYFRSDIEYYISLNNMTDGYLRIMGIILFGYLVLIIFIVWQQNKVIILNIENISILIACGSRMVSFFVYFLVTTLIKQLMYFIVSILIIKYLFMAYLSSEYFNWRLPWYLIIENIPMVLSALFISSLIVGLALYIKLKRKTVLFAGEE